MTKGNHVVGLEIFGRTVLKLVDDSGFDYIPRIQSVTKFGLLLVLMFTQLGVKCKSSILVIRIFHDINYPAIGVPWYPHFRKPPVAFKDSMFQSSFLALAPLDSTGALRFSSTHSPVTACLDRLSSGRCVLKWGSKMAHVV